MFDRNLKMPLFVSVERDYYFRCFRWFSLWILLWEVKFFEFSMRYNVSRWFFVTFYCILSYCCFSLILTFWYNLFNCYCEAFVTRVTIRGGSRGGSRAAATSKMECFVILFNGFQPLTIIAKHSILNVAAALDLPLYAFHHQYLKVYLIGIPSRHFPAQS